MAFEKQRELLLDQDKETQPSGIKEKSLTVPEVLGKKLKDDDEEEDDKIKAWKGEKKETKVVTILQEKEAGHRTREEGH